MLTLYQPPRPEGWGPNPNLSPFCIKLETYLRMTKQPYEIKFGNPRQAPKGKIPFIKDGDVRMGDSGLIIDYLKSKYGDVLDKDLTPEQRAKLHVIRRSVEEHTYFAVLVMRWSDENSWPYVRAFFMPFLPKLIGGVIINKFRKLTLARAYQQGVGRHTREEIIGLANADIDAYSVLLGDQRYFLGDKPTSLDATMFGFLISGMHVPWDNEVKSHLRSKKNLVDYVDRMLAEYWKESS